MPQVTVATSGPELLMRALAATSNGVLISDASRPGFPLIYANRAFERLSGYSEREILGRKCSLLQGPASDPAAIAAMTWALGEQRECRVTLVNYRKDGSPFSNEVSLSPVFDEDRQLTHYIGTQNDVTGQVAAEQALRESEERYRSVVASMSDGVVLIDASGAMSMWNKSAERILGLTADELRGRTTRHPGWKLIHEDGSEVVWEQFPAAATLRTGDARTGVILGLVKPDGTRTWANCNTQALHRPGEASPYAAVVTFSDITDHREAQEDLRRASETLQALIEHSPLPIVGFDREDCVTLWNPAAERTFGWNADEVLGKPNPIVGEEGEAASRRARRRSERGESWYSEEVGRKRRDGSPVTVSASSAPLRDAAGVLVGRVAVFVDVTSRREAEEALHATTRTLQAIVDGSPLAILATGSDGSVTIWNSEAERLLGWRRAEVLGKPPPHLAPPESSEPGDLESAGAAFSGVEAQRVRKDGSKVEVSISKSPLSGRDNEPAGVMAFMEDISGRKRNEAALREGEALLRTVVEGAPMILHALDRDGIFTLFEGERLEAFGLSPGQFVGKSVFAVSASEPAILDHVRRALAGETVTATVETRGLVLDARYTPVLDVDGEVSGVIGVSLDVTERHRQEEQLAYIAYHDVLTGLANRTLLEEGLRDAVEGGGSAAALLYLDLNDFKLVNDSLGHAAGDKLLIEIARRLQQLVRPEDVLARPGGDEFLLLLPGLSKDPARVAEAVAKKLLLALDTPFVVDGAEFRLDGRIGIALFPEHGDGADALIKNAHTALSQAEAAGSSDFALFQPQADDPHERLFLTARLRKALDRDEFVLHYQPIFALPGRTLAGVEALIRWESPEHGLVFPGTFIEVAEATGLIEPIGEWVVNEVARQSAQWRDNGFRTNIHFNVSPRQLFSGTTADLLGKLGRSSDLEAVYTVEITESVLRHDDNRVSNCLTMIRDAGLELALDDFGSGHSSLNRLRSLPFNTVKLDRAFLMQVPSDPEATAFAAAVIDLARRLGKHTVAEGVETDEQLQFLIDHDCPLAQGFYLGRPVPAPAAAAAFSWGGSGWVRQRGASAENAGEAGKFTVNG